VLFREESMRVRNLLPRLRLSGPVLSLVDLRDVQAVFYLRHNLGSLGSIFLPRDTLDPRDGLETSNGAFPQTRHPPTAAGYVIGSRALRRL